MASRGRALAQRIVLVAALGGLAVLAVMWLGMMAWPRLFPPKLWPLRWRQPPAHVLAAMPTAWRFQWPIGSTHGGLAYNAQAFGVRDVSPHPHLGDDLNGCYGYDTDLGDPVRAIASGVVMHTGYGGRGWGKVIAVVHALPGISGRTYIQSFYAHLGEILVMPGESVLRGQRIGSVGTADGAYYAHLHLEVRGFINPFVGLGYGEQIEGWLNPVEFIAAHRGVPDDDVQPEFAIAPEPAEPEVAPPAG